MSVVFKSEFTVSKSGFLFDHSTGLSYTLNPTGLFIFQQIQDGKQAVEILKALMDEFTVDEERARRDLDDFYRQMKELGLVE